jgi:invasion protein IalB
MPADLIPPLRCAATLVAAVCALGLGQAQTAAQTAVQTAVPVPAERRPSGDWMIECFDDPQLEAPCQIYQRVTYRPAGSVAEPVVVLIAALAYRGGLLHLEIALPLGFDLGQGALLGIGEQSFDLPVSRCTVRGCIVEGQLGDALARSLEAETRVGVTVNVPGIGPFLMPISMTGYREALASIRPAPPAGG